MSTSAPSRQRSIHASCSETTPTAVPGEHAKAKVGAVDLRRLLGVGAMLGTLLLAQAPSYSSHADAPERVNITLAVAGTMLVLPWLVYVVGLIARRERQTKRENLVRIQRAAWRRWQLLMACAWLFAGAAMLHAAVRVTAPLALTTLGLAANLIWQILLLSLALIYHDRPRGRVRLGWLALTPCSLAGMFGVFALTGDSWVTLLFGCAWSGIGPWAAARILRARSFEQWQRHAP